VEVNKLKIIVVNGKGGSGKTTMEKYFADLADSMGDKTAFTSMVKEVKNIANRCGWTGAKEDKDRKFLADLKDLLEDYNDLPFESVLNDILRAERDHCGYIFVDAREPKDIDRLKEMGLNIYTILVIREETNREYNNHADDEVFDYNYDYILENTGTLNDLKKSTETIFQLINEDIELIPSED
jgi:dephospho-CoA kinase